MRNRLLRFGRRPRAEQWLALQSLALSLLSVIALRLVGFESWRRMLWVSSDRSGPAETALPYCDVSVAQHYAAVVDMVTRNIPWGVVTCLSRSLTLCWLLRRIGVETELLIGVRKDGERLLAHAWVVCQGVVIGDVHPEGAGIFQMRCLAATPILYAEDSVSSPVTTNHPG
jgi:hypothetical protein